MLHRKQGMSAHKIVQGFGIENKKAGILPGLYGLV